MPTLKYQVDGIVPPLLRHLTGKAADLRLCGPGAALVRLWSVRGGLPEAAVVIADERRRGHDLSVSPAVKSLDLGVRWEPNAPAAVLVAHDDGGARLELRAHPDDPDQRSVALTWRGCRATRMEAPNDEAIGGHPLFRVGLGDVLWAGEVLDSPLVADMEERNRGQLRHDERRDAPLRHWILPLKEVVVEVVAEHLAVARVGAPAPTAG